MEPETISRYNVIQRQTNDRIIVTILYTFNGINGLHA